MRSSSVPSLVVITLLIAGLTGCGDNRAGATDAGTDAGVDAPDQPTEVLCEVLPPVASGTCEVTAGGEAKLLKGIVLTPTTVYRGGQVAVDASGQITCVGCDCDAGGETVISCPEGAISPGLINTHDHITFTQNPPYTDTGVRYEHRHQWRVGQDGKPRIPSAGSATADAVRWGELRFLMGGATSIVGSGGQPGILRNLDRNDQEGLGQTPVNFDTFPLGDSSGTRRTTDCNYGMATTAAELANVESYEPHTSEGIDDTARNEFLCQSSTSYDTSAPGVSNNLLLPKTAMIHAIGLQPTDLAAMAAAGTALIWSPRSNITLYGDTARVTTAARAGVEIALGTDWMPTGSMNLLRELRCADGLNKAYYNNHFTDADLWKMVTLNAASVTATDDVIGVLAPGKVADIAIFRATGGATFRAILDAEPQDVVLVIRGGKVLYGDDAAVGTLAPSCDPTTVDVCGTAKRVCLTGEVGKTYEALKTAAGATIYPAFACGLPENEPSCTPTRPTSANGSTIYTGIPGPGDADGDGIPDATDKCPSVFDPVRPVDDGVQGDADADGVGDACDVCPLDANATTCTAVNPDDRDSDGVANATDNCPDNANPNQADADADGKGDVCDACPNAANPGNAGCPVTIYDIKSGMTPVGTTVRVTGALVTGKGSNGFFVQVKESDAGYTGPDHSGLFVFTGASAATLNNATVGARVTIDGRVANFFGQLELDNVTAVTVVAAGPEASPAPIAVTYAEVKTGGPRAMTLESVIVTLGPSAVTMVNAMFGEFTVTAGADSLVVDDFLFVPSPTPTVGQAFSVVRGILNFRNSASKLEPRNADDLVAGAPGIASFGPALSFARVGETTVAPTFPQPLTVTLTGPAQGDTLVTVTSTDGALTVANVTIPNGATSATVPVTATAQNASVGLIATLGLQMFMTNVRVLGAAELPATVTLSPATASVAPGGSVTLTVTLDVPAPSGGTSVGLAVTAAGAGTVPATVTVPANELTATFSYTDVAGPGTSTVTATLGGSTSTTAITTAVVAVTHLVISQVYGGGGNSGAPFTHDFIELHNPTGAAISVNGMSVQYVSGTGTGAWAATALPNVSIPAGGFLLVQQASNSSTGAALPTPDATGTIPMGGTNGKVLLSSGATALSGACPTATVIDLVAYGTTNCSETAPVGALSNTTAALRNMNGCTDTDHNMNDFTVGAPVPRNSAATAVTCN
ncbi:MAG: amidohydrolase family protein [Myxococcota bacterium]|nr:amidohydrolase family protein [Myxococcota bacterium]